MKTSASIRDLATHCFPTDRLQVNGIKVASLLLIFWGYLSVGGFLSQANVNAVLYSVSAIGIAAVGMAFITLSGNLFMLSMAATAALATILFASILHYGLLAAMLGVCLLGTLIGIVQGLVVGTARVNPIITTIAVASIVMGVGSYLSGGMTVIGKGDASWLGIGMFASLVPNQLILFLVFAFTANYWVEKTRFGRELRLIGLNPITAAYSGIRVPQTLVIAFGVAGLCAALAGGLFASQAGQGNLKLATGLDFDAIAAVLVSGISIRGGQGKVIDAVYGALFLALISNLLLTHGLSFEIQLMVKGAVVVIAVILAALISRWRAR